MLPLIIMGSIGRVESTALVGLEAVPVAVECDVASGLASFHIVGLPDAAVREARERVRAAMANAGFTFPARRVTVNLSPADLRKEGGTFDLPIALAILAASGQIRAEALAGTVALGEVGLDASLRPVAGALPAALGARAAGARRLLLPAVCAPEAAAAEAVEVLGAEGLAHAVAIAEGRAPPAALPPAPPEVPAAGPDLADVRGQAAARRALEIAAAGGHNLLLVGPPGTGKSMLARRLPSILPPMTRAERLEATRVASVAGLTLGRPGLVADRPFRAPHHTASAVGLVGGGAVPRPGEATLAHLGVLFLDELPEFGRPALEALREPLETGAISIARAAGRVTLPARFLLVATMNPCPCGHLGDPARVCACSPAAVARYRSRVSGPLLDRIDLHVEIPRPRAADLAGPPGEASAAVRARVVEARGRQARRYGSVEATNATAPAVALRRALGLAPAAADLLHRAFDRLGLSGRGYERVLRVARTIADLRGAARIEPADVAEAVSYRSLDRPAPIRLVDEMAA